MDIRELINEMSYCIEWTNKTFGYKDTERNREHYVRFSEVISTLEDLGVKADVTEFWENGLVCLEVTLENVRF